MQALQQRKNSASPILRAIGGHENRSASERIVRKRSKGLGSIGVPKPPAHPSQRGKPDNEELIVDLETLRQLLQDEFQESPESQTISVDLKSQESVRGWKSAVAHECRNAVVKILSQVVEFDWSQPYRRAEVASAIGSGFFVSEDGLIVTNAHVIEEARKVWITIPSHGEQRYNAEILGVCFDVDLALLRVSDVKVSKFLEFGDSNSVQYGQEVLTLGYPLGMESLKLTEGIISGRQESFFQTDAPLNPGNSGGPMLNSQGQVIGINVAIAEMSQNVGFSIPVSHLEMLFPTLKSRPKDRRVIHKPILGAEFTNSNESLQSFFGCSERSGVYVRRCYEGFPFHNAGVREGDILHEFNGFDLDNFGNAEVPWSPYARASLDSLISLMVYDSKPKIVYSSNGEMRTATINFEDPEKEEYPILPIIREYYPPFEEIDYEVVSGMVVMNLTLNHIETLHEIGISEAVIRHLTPIAASFEGRTKRRLVVSNVLLGSSLQKVQVFAAGTLLEEVNGIKVHTLEDFRNAIKKPILRNDVLYLTFKSESNDFVVLPLRECFREEFELSDMHLYKISPLMIRAMSANKSMLDYACQGDKKLLAKFHSLLRELEDEK